MLISKQVKSQSGYLFLVLLTTEKVFLTYFVRSEYEKVKKGHFWPQSDGTPKMW